MSFSKATLSVVFIFLLTYIAEAKNGKEKLRWLSASSEESSGGAYGSPSVVNYTFYFQVHTSSKNLKLENLWVNEKASEFKFYNLKTGALEFEKNDTLVVLAKTYKVDPNIEPKKELETSIAIQRPNSYPGDALLSYSNCNKKRYVSILTIKKLPKVYRP